MNFYKKFLVLCAIALFLVACGSGGGGESNSAPVAISDAASVPQNTSEIINLQATDADGDSLTYSISTQPQNGTVNLSNNIVTYTPTNNYVGSDSFSFTANDGEVDSNIAVIDITVDTISSLLGRITAADGTVVAGVLVNILDSQGISVGTEMSAGDGTFTIAKKTNTDLLLSFTKDGFANQITPVKTPGGNAFEAPLDVVMIERNTSQTISADVGGTLSGADGATVTIAANSFVDASGNPVTGDIDVNMTPVDISNQAQLAAFPGEFLGVVESSGVESSIASLGTVEFVFTQNGAPLQLANNITADIQIPLYTDTNPATGAAIQIGDIIDLWSLDETTGIWLKEDTNSTGTGTVVADSNSPTGFALSATVSHFTWWNCDVTINPGKVTVTVDGNVGLGVAKIYARTDVDIGSRPSQADMNIDIGTTSSPLFLAAGGESCLWVEYYINGLVASTPEQCITVTAGGTYALTFNIYSNLPLEIAHAQNDVYGVNITASPILLRALSLEQSVTYAISSGALPNGMTLVSTSPTNAQIQGVPTETGSFSVIVEGTDGDANTNTTTIIFDVVNLAPPSLDSAVILKHPNTVSAVSFDLTVYNNGGLATNWAITNTQHEYISCCVSISNTGILSFVEFIPSVNFNPSFQIDVTATNDAGSSSMVITTELGTM